MATKTIGLIGDTEDGRNRVQREQDVRTADCDEYEEQGRDHWLLDEPSRLTIECTGFGLNLVSGNFEFASLIVVESEEFWTRYGGQVEANCESSSLRQYSSLDRDSLTDLAADVA